MHLQDLPVHTLIREENQTGSLLLCGLNHGYSKNDERLDAVGVERADPYKSFFSDRRVNDYLYRNILVKWFDLWGYPLSGDEDLAGPFERSIVQTNWLQTCSHDLEGVNVQQECIAQCESFLATCAVLKPKVILFFGRELLWAFTSAALAPQVGAIFGQRLANTTHRKKDVYSNGMLRRRFEVAFQEFEHLSAVSLPHPTGSVGLADDYIAAFRPELSTIIERWWQCHRQMLNAEPVAT